MPRYDAYGNPLIFDKNGVQVDPKDAFSKNKLMFTGREYDFETDMYYYRARYYEPTLGRFLQVDPDAGTINKPTSLLSKYIC